MDFQNDFEMDYENRIVDTHEIHKGYAKEMVNALVQFGAQNGIKTVLADVAAENAGSCGVMRALGFTPTENGTFRRSGSQTEYKNLTFKKEL